MFEIPLGEDARMVLFAERLRDGRIALGTRTRQPDGRWRNGELHLLGPPVYLALAGWLAGAVEDTWADTIRERQADQLQTAFDLYGEGPGAVQRLADEVLHEIPPHLIVRALILLINSIGPHARERLVARLNRTDSAAEDAALRRRLSEERDALAYAVAAAALFDAQDRNLTAGSDPSDLPAP